MGLWAFVWNDSYYLFLESRSNYYKETKNNNGEMQSNYKETQNDQKEIQDCGMSFTHKRATK